MITKRKLTQRERRIAIATVSVLFAGLLYVAAIEPVAKKWIEAYSRARAVETQLVRLQDLAGRRAEIEEEYSKVQDAVMVGKSEEELLAVLLTEVEEVARASGLTVSGLKPVGKKRAAQFDRYGVEVSARGDAANFVKFLYRLQSPEHMLTAEKITLVVGRSAPKLTLTVLVTKIATVGTMQ